MTCRPPNPASYGRVPPLEAKKTARAAQLLGHAHVKLDEYEDARAAWSLAMKLDKKLRKEMERMIAGIAGALLAIPALRVRGPYLAMVTIAFAFG